MDVKSSQVAQLYQNARPATQPSAQEAAPGAGEAFARVARDFADTVRRARRRPSRR